MAVLSHWPCVHDRDFRSDRGHGRLTELSLLCKHQGSGSNARDQPALIQITLKQKCQSQIENK